MPRPRKVDTTKRRSEACARVRKRACAWHERCSIASMPRAIWSGSLGFGLVQIPVTLHAAEETDELSLTLLDKRDFSPVGYERINKKTGKEVKWEDTVKGYESGPGKCVVLPHGKALSLLVLRFADELRGTSDLELPEENLKKLGITSKELDMAEKLVSGMVDKWQPERYRDDYRKDLLSLIHARAKAGDVNSVAKEPTKAPRVAKPAKVVDLVALLAKSVEAGHSRKSDPHAAARRTRAATSRKKRAPSKRRSTHTATQHRKSA